MPSLIPLPQNLSFAVQYPPDPFLDPLPYQIQQILKGKTAGAHFVNLQDGQCNASLTGGNPFSSLLILADSEF